MLYDMSRLETSKKWRLGCGHCVQLWLGFRMVTKPLSREYTWNFYKMKNGSNRGRMTVGPEI